ncbi:MAG TPA: S16 family serine protease, partial [Rhizomicrobium sp.]|nr:S16 family serine protease [Rhizomicrobium sp.]
KENEKDLAEVPDNVKTGLKIVPVSDMGEVLAAALVREPVAIDWSEPEAAEVVPRVALDEGDPDPLVTH